MVKRKDRVTLIISKSQIEFWFLGSLILLGIVFRIWRLFDLGLIHFDEGVYAISGLWTITPFDDLHLYVKQKLFSPPLFFSLVGISYWILGEASDKAAILVNVVIGSATIPLVWWFTQKWFGRGAGIAAAVLVAFSDFHIAYSRMVLTDITFCFFFLLALALIAATMERVSFCWAIISGIAVGAAWNTKYHGWLLLFVALIMLVIISLTGRNNKSPWKRLLLCWIVITVVAVACYLPWAIYVQIHSGGYLSLMKYQRGYLDPNWLSNLWRQVEMQLYMDGWLSRISPVIAFLLTLAIEDKRQWPSLNRILLVLIIILCSGLFLGGVGTALILSVLALSLLIKLGSYACWLVLSSFGLFFLLTPLYHPYPRILMPAVLMIYIASGVGIGKILKSRETISTAWEHRPNKSSIKALLASGTILLVVFGLVMGFRPTPRTWMATDSIRKAATTIARTLPKGSAVFIHGEPTVAFYLRLAGHRAIPIDNPLDHPEVTTRYNFDVEKQFLVTGIYAQHRDPGARASLKRLSSHLNTVGAYSIQPNDVRLLNDFTPDGALQYRLHPSKEYNLYLYRITPHLNSIAKYK